MKRYIPYIFTIILLTTLFVGGFGNVAHANIVTSAGCLANFSECVADVVANVVNIILSLTGWLLALAGFMLNISMNATLNIKEFVEGTPALYTVWKSIRDISGMFLIFLLLYAGIRMILGFDAKMKNLVTTIVMAGILINFSFFITGLGIDVSNMVSMQLYNSIAPQNNMAGANQINSVQGVKAALDGGISDIFMTALLITNVYDGNTIKLTSGTVDTGSNILSATIKIILGGVFGILILLSAAISFFIISLALIARLVILVFLLGFSPIVFAGFAIPQLSDYVKKWRDLYIGQLVFLPVYLLLMYFALTILSQSNMFRSGFAGALTASNEWYINFLVLGVNAAFVIIMLNAPLLAALKLGATAPSWAKDVDAFSMWKKVGTLTGRNTFGRAAHIIDNSDTMKKGQASKSLITRTFANIASNQAKNLGNYGFGEKKGGFKDTLDTNSKERAAIHEKVIDVDKSRYDTSTQEGKDALKRAEEAAKGRGKAYRDALNTTVLSSLMKSNFVKKSTDAVNAGIWKATGAVTDAMEYAKTEYGVKGMDKASQVMLDGAKAATQAVSSAPIGFSNAANIADRKAGSIIDKKNKDAAKKKAKEEAQNAKKDLDDAFSKWDLEHDEEQTKLRDNLLKLDRSIVDNELEAKHLAEIVEREKAMNNHNLMTGRPSTTSTEELRLANINTALAKMKTEKIKIEGDKFKIDDERTRRIKENNIKKRELDKTIQEGRDVETRESTEGLKSDLDKSIKDSAPKPTP